MIRQSSSRASVTAWGLAATAGALLLARSATARADDVPATGKGITGGALLGGEVIMLGEAIFGVQSGWMYLFGGVVGAGAGAYGGHVAEQNADAKTSLYLLAGGMALVIPTTVAVLQATSYHPPEDYTEDHPAAGAPVPEPPRPTPAGGPSTAPAPPSTHLHYHWAPARMTAPLALLSLDDGAMRVAVPPIELRPVYGSVELSQYGLSQQHELRLSVFSAKF